ncbi:MAG: PAC2 family protein [Actinomycetales bacterium]|nr:PAC2 family protein [Actinomycetales bacterium]
MTLLRVHADPVSARPVLVHAFAGFLDAGGGGRLAVAHMIESLPSRVVADFDIDLLYDYRGRRPRATFLSDHYGEIELPELQLHEVTDSQGQGFLVLNGPEPDLGWRSVRDAIIDLVVRWDISLVVGMQGVPFPAPHTRPVQVTAHGNDSRLIAGRTPWVGDIEVPGSLAGLLELALTAKSRTSLGLVAHVPHYLAAADYPAAAVRLIEEFSATTGLTIPLDDVRESAEQADAEIERQVSSDPDNRKVVAALEEQFDGMVAARADESGAARDLPLATGDEIAAQVEQFLAELDR